MERSNTQHLADIIRTYLKENRLERPLKERALIASWEELLGRAVARATTKIYIREGILHVHLKSSVIRNELHMLQKEIIRKMNEQAGETLIREMVLK